MFFECPLMLLVLSVLSSPRFINGRLTTEYTHTFPPKMLIVISKEFPYTFQPLSLQTFCLVSRFPKRVSVFLFFKHHWFANARRFISTSLERLFLNFETFIPSYVMTVFWRLKSIDMIAFRQLFSHLAALKMMVLEGYSCFLVLSGQIKELIISKYVGYILNDRFLTVSWQSGPK